MNTILIRTDKGEYLPGDKVCGVVYLNIENPTAGRGVQLRFKGFEHFLYEYAFGTSRNNVEATKDYIDWSDVSLYQREDPFALGSYMFPFKVTLPQALPGSFKANRDANISWVANVKYWLEAGVVGVSNMTACQDIVIFQCTNKMLTDRSVTEAQNVEHVIRHFPFKTFMNFTVKLVEKVQVCGQCAKLRLIITNETRVSIKSFKIKLLRNLVFSTKGEIPNAKSAPGISCLQRKTFIQPEGGPYVVWETVGSTAGTNPKLLDRVLDNFLIPLRTSDGNPIPPSVKGYHIECQYGLEILFVLSNGATVNINHPIPCILPMKNTQWQSWQAPDWVSRADLVLSDSQFSISSQELGDEAFAGLPGFQVL